MSKRKRPSESIDYQPSTEVCFVAIGSLGRAKRITQCKVFRPTTITVQREGKRRTVAYIETTSCS